MTLLEKLLSMDFDKKVANGLIMSGKVLINDVPTIIGSTKIKPSDNIRIKTNKEWVSRGAYKLLHAIDYFNIEIKDKVCLDVGSSTGGFTQVLLAKNAQKVYALDVGTNQLDFQIRTNPKVISLENTNLKNINKSMFNELIDFLCCDVSFISCKNLFDILNKENILNKDNLLVILIKPQFEAKYELVSPGGFVDLKYHKEIIDNIINYAKKNKFSFLGFIESPIKGNKSQNIEYLALFRKEKYE